MFRAGRTQIQKPWVSVAGDRQILHPAPITIYTEPLTPQSFAPFGSVIEDPEYPHYPPRQTPLQQPTIANQGSARKYSNVSPITNNYDQAPSCKPATVQMSYFACEPRRLGSVLANQELFPANKQALDALLPFGLFKVEVMERHPFTTQTFTPTGLADTITPALEKHPASNPDYGTGFVVIVAPTALTANGEEIPDVAGLKAFLANGRQAVTYGANVWHAPMVVVGKDVVGFVVTQWANGVAEEDCQEMFFQTQQITVDDCVAVLVKGFGARGSAEKL